MKSLLSLDWGLPLLAMFAVSAASLWFFFLLREMRRVWAPALREVARGQELPPWLRYGLVVVAPLAKKMAGRLPRSWYSGLEQSLRRAGLDELVQAEQFLCVGVLLPILPAFVLSQVELLRSLSWGLAVLFWLLPWIWLRDQQRQRSDEIIRDLPLYIDMLTLALEAGGALSVAIKVATDRSPDGVLRRAFLRVQGDLRAGRSRAEALRALGERLDTPAVLPLVASLIQAETSGGSLASVLRAQAEQRLNERFTRAEKMAMEAPVKMLAPLVICIFPCTFLILAFPVAMRFLQGY